MSNSLRVIAFPGAPNLPTFAAIEHDKFTEIGYDVELELTPSSIYQAEKTAAGEFDIICTAFDNVVAYGSGQGAAKVGVDPDYVVVMGATQLELSLVANKDIKSVADLAGKTIALDALTTGFAFVLFDMLEAAGLTRNDVEFVAVGATPLRWQSVQDGVHAATLTIEPFTSIARLNGFNILSKSTDIYDEYQGGVVATTKSTLANHPGKVSGFIECYLKGLEWVLDTTNADAAKAILGARMPQIKPKAMDAVMASLSSEKSGLTPKSALLEKGMETVISLRSKYGDGATVSSAETFIDLHLYNEKIKALS